MAAQLRRMVSRPRTGDDAYTKRFAFSVTKLKLRGALSKGGKASNLRRVAKAGARIRDGDPYLGSVLRWYAEGKKMPSTLLLWQ
eukprot:scaffold3951_cov258-Pinguiococcus_pyrenoidosus.AAC.2